MPKNQTINVNIDGHQFSVTKAKYCASKLKSMREFGYTTLTLADVEEQLEAALAKKEIGAGLTVIGAFIKSDLAEQEKA